MNTPPKVRVFIGDREVTDPRELTPTRLVVRTHNGRVLLDTVIHPGTVNEVVLPNSTRMTETSIEYRRQPE